MSKLRTLSIILPVFNEVKTIRYILEEVLSVELSGVCKEVIVVDDGSSDGTRKELEFYKGKENVKVIYHDQNYGKGRAVKTGILESTGDIVIIQDADLEYDPKDWTLMVKPFEKGLADAVFGSRFVGQGPRRSLYMIHHLSNQFLTFTSNLLTGYNISDMETCYKMLDGDIAREIAQKLESDDFMVEPELTARLAKKRARLYEVGISYYGRTYEEGKKIYWTDGIKALWAILKYNLFT